MFCQNCQYEYTDQIKFCPKCGNEINYFVVSEKQNQLNKNNQDKVHIINSGQSSSNSIQLGLNQFELGLIVGFVGSGMLMWLILK